MYDDKFRQDGTKIKSLQLRNNRQTKIIVMNYTFTMTVFHAYKEVAPFCLGTKLDLMVCSIDEITSMIISLI